MPADLAARLEEWKRRFGARDATELHELLREAAGHECAPADELIRLHECLLFLRAYPADAEAARLADAALSRFAKRVGGVEDREPFEDPAVSGIAGSSFSAVFSYDVARQLAARYPRQIEIDWENYDRVEKLGPVLRRFLPLENEDWPVEAHVPFRAWVEAARLPGETSLAWLLKRLVALPEDERDRGDLYDSLELLLIWQVPTRVSRSLARRPAARPASRRFYHREPLLTRRDFDFEGELYGPPLPVRRLAAAEARTAIEFILDTSATRYRELYGFTHPDARRVFSADAGRGVEIVYFGIPPDWRLPLRAYLGGMFFKNGVPAGYVEVLSLFERAEVGFNLYYTFREGESAWLYARLLRLFRQVLGARCFSVDPYQAGHENEEAVASGAFWFYRKLGFRALRPEAAQITAREEDRMARTPGYRSTPRTLRKLANSYLLYECRDAERGAWDRFSVRNFGLACARMPTPVFGHLAAGWSHADRAAVEAIERAKRGPDEGEYLRLMQRHERLRETVIALGSKEL